MITIDQHIAELVTKYLDSKGVPNTTLPLTPTRDDFEGDFTIVVFPIAGRMKQAPQAVAEDLGTFITAESEWINQYNVVKGFLNLSCTQAYWIAELRRQIALESPVPQTGSGKIVLEYASPNSNKPLHLGHIRNILLGWSVGQLLEATGHQVHYTQVVNDRGIAICKSMISWQRYYDGQTPQSTDTKPDHFVGEAYVTFSKKLDEEYNHWQSSDTARSLLNEKGVTDADAFFSSYKNEYFNEYSELGRATRDMLIAWEGGDTEVRALWQRMKDWFMIGFSATTERLGIRFDSMLYESDTYVVGKEIVEEGLEKGVFTRDPDGSIWIDLTDMGWDRKILIRSDGTSLYITQDLGTARLRYEQIHMDGMIYTVGNEQDYHFQVLFEALRRLDEPYADRLHHLSYGMVDLPSGKMKTREGTVVDADDLIDEVIARVHDNSAERGELDLLPADERRDIIEKIGMGALKYYMLRVEAKKRMLFNPEESVDLQGQTGPYIQNAYVRIQSIGRKLAEEASVGYSGYEEVNQEEKLLLRHISDYGQTVLTAAEKYDPAIIAQYAYQLARLFHKFYHDHSILRAESDEARSFRADLADLTADRLASAMALLGIEMPNRM